MKRITQIAAFLLLTIFTSRAYSQISLGGQVSYLTLTGGSGLKHLGFGIKGDYAQSDRLVLSGGINLYGKSSFTETLSASAFDLSTNPRSINVEAETSASFTQLYFGVKRYFSGDYEDDFGFYGIAEIGALFGKVKSTLADFDMSKYGAGREKEVSESVGNFTINLGLGVEKQISFGYLFFDLKLNLPAQANNTVTTIEIPTTITYNLGLRYPLN